MRDTHNALLAIALTVPLLPACSRTEVSADTLPEQRIENAIGMELVLVPAGEFMMGSPEDESGRREDEGPRHRVRISEPFYAGVTEVTVGQFAQFVEESGYVTEAERDKRGGFGFDMAEGTPFQTGDLAWNRPGFEQTDEHPVVHVSWIDAEAFCAWLSEKDGREYRLPSEAQWEYACRAGTITRWWFGDDPTALARYANVADESLPESFPAVEWAADWHDGHAFTAPVASFEPNPWGLHDVTGNAWEWCSDWHDPEFYASAPERDPVASEGERMRAIRGGGWYDPAERTRSAQRAWFFPIFRYCMLSGFRVVCDAS